MRDVCERVCVCNGDKDFPNIVPGVRTLEFILEWLVCRVPM